MSKPKRKKRWCLFQFCPDKQVAWHDEKNMPVTYATEREAYMESIDTLEEGIRQFKEGTRDYEEIEIPDDWPEPVEVDEFGLVYDNMGRRFGKRT
jgi:hypothetical protein